MRNEMKSASGGKRIDGIYRQIKQNISKPENKRRLTLGSLLTLVLAILIFTVVNIYPSNRVKATIEPVGSMGAEFVNTAEPTFVVDTAGQITSDEVKSSVGQLTVDSSSISASVTRLGESVELQPEITTKGLENSDQLEVKLKSNQFKPGKYQLNVKLFTSNGEQNLTQDFTWGVLALNLDKSSYKIGEEAKIGIGVLDDMGATVCDAKVWLKITDSEGQTAELSTYNKSIAISNTCANGNVTNIPDYQANYTPKTNGTYQIELKAETENGPRALSESFEVLENPDFVVRRFDTSMRIFPPADYTVNIEILANKDLSGGIKEKVPASFAINNISSGGEISEKSETTQTISWSASLKSGESIKLSYQYDAPDISPQFYLLGPIEIWQPVMDAEGGEVKNTIVFTEPRPWQIAADAPSTVLDGTEVTGTQRSGQHKVVRTTNGASSKRTFVLSYSANEVINLSYSDDPEAGSPSWVSVGTVSTGGNDESADMEWDTTNNVLYIVYGREAPADAAASDVNYKIVTDLATTPALGTERVALNATTSVNFTHPVIEIGSDSGTAAILIYANYYNNTAVNPSAIYLASTTTFNNDNPTFTTTANIKTWTAAAVSGIISIGRVNAAKTVLFYDDGVNLLATEQLNATDANATASYCSLAQGACAGTTTVSADGPIAGKMTGSIYGNPSSDAIWFSWLDAAFDINTRLWTAAGGLGTELVPVAGAAVVLGPAIVGNASNLYLVYQKVADTTIMVRQSRSITDGTSAWSGTETTLEDHASENLTYPSIGEVMNQDYLDITYTTATNALVRHMSVSLPPPITVSGGCFTNAGEGTPCTDGGASDQIKVAVNGVLDAGSDGTVDGGWTFTINKPASGAILVFYRDGAPTAAEKATTVVKYDGDGGNVTLVKMYQSMLVIGADAGSTNSDQTIANSDLDTTGNGYEYSDDADSIYGVDTGTLTVDQGANLTETLYIISGDIYQPDSAGGDTVTTHHLYFEGTYTTDNNATNVAGDWTNAGTFTATTGTVTFNGSAAQTIISNGASFNNVTFNNSSVADPNINYTGALTIGGNVSLSNTTRIASTNNTAITISGTINGINILSINSGSGAVTFGGIIGGSIPITSLTSSGSGAIAINTTAISTRDVAGNNVSFTGAVILGGNLNITTDRTTNDGTITFSSTINGANTLTLDNGGGAVTFGGIIGGTTPISALTVSGAGTIAINTTGISTRDVASNNVSFTGPVTLGANLNITTDNTTNDGTISFSSTVNSADATDRALTLASGAADISVSGAIGATFDLASIAITSNDISLANIGGGAAGVTGATSITSTDGGDTGVLTLSGTIYQTNAATYVGGSLGGISITGASAVFTTSADNITFTNTATLGDISAVSVTTSGSGAGVGDITFGTIRGTSDEDITLNASSANATVGLIGDETANEINTIAITGATITLNGNIYTSDAAGNTVTLTGAAALAAGVNINTDETTNDGTISFSSTVNSADATDRALTLASGAADISVSGAIGATFDLASITITGNDISLANIGAGASGVTGATAIIGDTNGTIILTGTIYNTAGTQAYNAGGATRTITLNEITAFTTTDDTIDFTGLVNSQTAENNAITLNAGTAQVTFNNNVGATQSIGVLTKQGSGDVKFGSVTLTSTGLTLLAGTINTAATDSGAWTVNGTVTISAGTLKSTTNTLSVSGNWSNSGAFTANGGTVILTGAGASTQEISGDNTFYNLTAQATSARTLKFESIKTQAITNTLDMDGAAGQLITLTTITGTTQWKINPTNATTVTYVDVNYSNNLGASLCAAYSMSTNNNNTAWGISAGASCNTAPNVPSSLLQKKVTGGATLATGDWTNETQVQFTATASDTDNPDTLYFCVEKDILATALSSINGGDLCGSGVAYSGTPVTVSVTITGLTDTAEYHWQAQVKDAGSLYSSFVGYGGNTENPPTNPAARDFGIDTTAPTGGTVYDGITGDQDWNDGSLTSISGNWTGFDASASGLNKYEYAIRRKPDDYYWSVCSGAGSWQAGANWCDNAAGTSFTQNTLNLQTGVIYYNSVRATDNASNTASPVNSNGQQVSPTLSFTLSGNTITFDDLNNSNSWTDSKTGTVTTSTNASAGYNVSAYITQLLTSLAYPSQTIANFYGTWTNPEPWPSGTYGFGYTSSDTLVQGSNRFNSGTEYAAFSQTASGDVAADHTDAVNGSTGSVVNEQFTITYKVAVSTTQAASAYRTYAIYIATANY